MQYVNPPINIIIIADDPLVRAGLASSLESDNGIIVIAQLSSADFDEEVFDLVNGDLLVVDEGWADTDENESRFTLRMDIPILQLVDPSVLESMVRIPSDSVISRESSAYAIRAAIHAVSAGWTVLDPLASSNRATDPSMHTEVVLTEREKEVLTLIAEGITNKAISNKLEISENTVKYHVNAILSKLNAQSRTEAVVIAARSGLLPL
jgi:two-component system nitrate/nitrite response regulator NarL